MALSLKDLGKIDRTYTPLGGRYIMALDSGTTSVRAIIVDEYDCVVAQASRHIKTMYPRSGWVEQDPMEILASQIAVMMEVQFKSGIHSDRIAAIGITNQRETTVVWDRDSGQPIHNAIVWQCRRTAGITDASSPRVCRTPFGARRDSCPIRTSRVPRSSGSSTTSMAPAPLPMRES